MKKVIRLTESDLMRIVKRVIKENNAPGKHVRDIETGKLVGTHKDGVGFTVNEIGERMGYESDPDGIPNGTKMGYNDNFPIRMNSMFRSQIRTVPSKMGRPQMPPRRMHDNLNENDFEDERPIDREAAYKEREFLRRKTSLENIIQNRDLETILTLLGDEEYHVERFLKELKPFGITTYDELVAYKEGYEEEDEY